MPLNSGDREADDLTAIKGIGPVRQRWLRESLGVRTFRDLAALSADDIESRLKAEGQIASWSEIDGWIAEAEELAVAANTSPQQVVEPPADAVRRANSPAGEGEWKPFASFVVEFQARAAEGRARERRTTVHYMEGDRGETWPGIEGQSLCRWMLDQMGETVDWDREEEAPGEARPVAPPPVTVDITQIQAFQPPHAASPVGIGRSDRPFSGFVRSGEPLAFQVSFALAGPTAAVAAKEQVAYRARFYAGDLSTGERMHLGDTEPDALVEGNVSYTAMVAHVTFQPGLYRLLVLTTVETTPPSVGYLEVPMLQVV
jgi:hypothetical protein